MNDRRVGNNPPRMRADHAARLLGCIGQQLDDVYGARVGRVEDVLVDERSGEPVWLVARLGRFGDQRVPVPAADAVLRERDVWLPYDRRRIKSAPGIAPGAPLSRDHELAAAEHYGIRGRRAARLAELPGDAVTSVPARHAHADGADALPAAS